MTYKIRLANLQDIDWIVKDVGRSMIFDELHQPEFYDQHTLIQLTQTVINEGVVLILTRGTQRVGVLGGFLAPHYFNPKIKTLYSLFLYVKPEYRSGSGFSRLLRAYKEQARELGVEAVLTIRDESNIKESSLLRLGFKRDEVSYRLKG